MGSALTALIGWHWAFLPSFFAELVPGLDLAPTWTLAVFYATRQGAAAPPARPRPPDVIDAEVVKRD